MLHQPVFMTQLVTATATYPAGTIAGLARALAARRPVGATEWHDADLVDWGGPAARLLLDDAVALARGQSVDIAGGGRDRFGWRAAGRGIALAVGTNSAPRWSPAAYWTVLYELTEALAEPATLVEFEDPRMPLIVMEAPSLGFRPDPDAAVAEPMVRQPLTTHTMLMFPGWLRHTIQPAGASGDRLFVAVDLIALPPG